jgi:hypothetical protein
MMRFTRAGLLGVLLLLLNGISCNAGRVVVSPSDGAVMINKQIRKLSPGDTLVYSRGIYSGPFILMGVHGLPNLPVVITGISERADTAVIDSGSEPGMDLDKNAFQLIDCSWIVIDGFRIRNCWTDIITAVDVSYLSVRQCDVVGGKRLLYATGRKSHHFLVEHCRWEQDVRVWTQEEGYTWEELHHGKHRHFNGSIFQGEKISGVFVLRHNRIKNTFNAFRVSPVGDGRVDVLASSNGEIYNNLIINTSDNVLEPEVYCHNLYFYHNRLVNGHAFISVTEVGGGPIYLFGNTGLSEPDCEDGWAIYKISNRERSMSEPFYIFNNSWLVDYNITGRRMGWWNDHIVHFNNAYLFEGIDTFGIHSTGPDSYYDFDCSSAVFPEYMIGKGFEQDGIVGDPMFRDPLDNDFRLQIASPCVDKGRLYKGLVEYYQGAAPDIGAYEGTSLVSGPAFKFSHPGINLPFLEHPRITRYKINGQTLVLWFSVPMDMNGMYQCHLALLSGKDPNPATLTSVGEDGHRFIFTLGQNVNPESDQVLMLDGWPTAKNGMEMVSWASAIKVLVTVRVD